jgi:hypothetical protein
VEKVWVAASMIKDIRIDTYNNYVAS